MNVLNKKVALFLFALGLGAAAAPAVASSCYYWCAKAYSHCIASGADAADCAETQTQCEDSCG